MSKNEQAYHQNDWTVMVYLAGDNNLAEEMVYALKSMQLVGSNPDKYEVFALYDAGVGPAMLKIGDRLTLPGGVPPLGNLLVKAEEARRVEAKAKVTETEKALGAAVGQERGLHNKSETAKTHIAKANFEPRVPDITEKARTLLRADAKAVLDSAKAAHTAAVAAARDGGPEFVESVETALRDFVIKTIQEHPAKHYMLVLSGHGSGAVGDFLSSNKRFLSLSIPDLADALEAIHKMFNGSKFLVEGDKGHKEKYLPTGKIDILGLDSCLMGMAEVAYEIHKYVDYLVGAEGFEANTGWPYDHILNLLRVNSGVDPEELAHNIVREYIKYYSSDYTLAGVSTDLSALRLSEINGFAEALAGKEGLSELLRSALKDTATRDVTRDAIVLAHWGAQGFKNEQHVDVYDFCELLRTRCGTILNIADACRKIRAIEDAWREVERIAEACEKFRPIADACTKVQNAIDKLVLSNGRASGYCGPAFQYSRGISIFFPWANITDAANVSELEHYKASLAFAQHTKWDEFLAAYHESTQRPPRPGGDTHLSTLNRLDGLYTGKPQGRAGSANPEIRAGSANPEIRAGSANPEIRMTGAGRLGIPKIASMKNPPILWHDCDLIAQKSQGE